MGTDIQAEIEVRRDGDWTHVGNDYRFRYLGIRRSYRLFGRLSGVRSSFGNPIAPDRGLPDDVTATSKNALEWRSDSSWATLRELQAHPWPEMRTNYLKLLVNPIGWMTWRAFGHPFFVLDPSEVGYVYYGQDAYSSGRRIEYVDPGAMDALWKDRSLDKGHWTPDSNCYPVTRVWLRTLYSERFPIFTGHYMRLMEHLAPSPDDVRLVFSYSS